MVHKAEEYAADKYDYFKKLKVEEIYSCVNLMFLRTFIDKIFDLKGEIMQPYQQKLKTMRTYIANIEKDLVYRKSYSEIDRIQKALDSYTIGIERKKVQTGFKDQRWAFAELEVQERIINEAITSKCMYCTLTKEQAKGCQFRKDIEKLGFATNMEEKLTDNGCPFSF